MKQQSMNAMDAAKTYLKENYIYTVSKAVAAVVALESSVVTVSRKPMSLYSQA
tara:strand:+ start:2918 stop:3076 length:159 start_codon:yes stop_codon:yes gene_type:complete